MDFETENKVLLREYQITKDTNLLADLYQANQGLFNKIISKYNGLGEKDDMLQECFIALLKAIETYREESGTFSNYLSVIVSNHLHRYINNNNMIIAPEYMQIWCYKYRILKDKGYSDKKILDELGISREQLKNIKRFILVQNVRSLEEPIENDFILGDFIADQSEYQEQVINKVFSEEITKAIQDANSLTEREKAFIYKRYYENMTYREIDPEHSEHNTRTIITRALMKLRKNDKMQKFYQEINIYSHNSFAYFKRTHTSGVERAVILKNEK